jgi:hypothetical protein
MHFNGTNGSTTMTDNSKNNVAFTVSGNSQISTAQSKFGGASILFDGTGDYLSSPSVSDFAFGTGDFTIECWIYSSDVSFATQRGFLQTSDTVGGLKTSFTTGILIGAGSPVNGALFATVAGTNVGSSTAVITTNTWYHIALVRNSGTSTLYVNGTSVGSATTTGNCSGTYLAIGGYYNTSYLYQGYIDELRITKGIARYTSNFTPSTTQFLDSAGDANSNVVVNSTATGFAIGTGGINGAQLAKAWVNFDGTGTVAIRDSYNVSSITDNGTGDYTVNYSTALNNSNYCALGSSRVVIGTRTSVVGFSNYTTTSIRLETINLTNNLQDEDTNCVTIFSN